MEIENKRKQLKGNRNRSNWSSQAKKEINLIHGKKYSFIEHYMVGNDRMVKLKCNNHDEIIDVKYHCIIRNPSNKCKGCHSLKQSNRKRNSAKEIRNRIINSDDSFIKSEYYFLGLTDKQVNNGAFKSELKCNYHDKVFYQLNSEVGIHRACPNCKNELRRKLTNEEIKKDTILRLKGISKKFAKRFQYLRFNKIKSRIKVNLICNKHDYPYPFWTFKNRINEKICDRCCDRSKSLGVIKIEKFLSEKKINFTEEFRFKDCKNILILPFDFYIKKYNLLIEFDGEQHFKPQTNFGGENKFKKGILRDIIKNEYAFEKKINFLRIPYTELSRINDTIENTIKLIKKGEMVFINSDSKIVKKYNDVYVNFRNTE